MIIYKQNDFFTIKADFYRTASGKVPVIMHIHRDGLLWGGEKRITEEIILMDLPCFLLTIGINFPRTIS